MKTPKKEMVQTPESEESQTSTARPPLNIENTNKPDLTSEKLNEDFKNILETSYITQKESKYLQNVLDIVYQDESQRNELLYQTTNKFKKSKPNYKAVVDSLYNFKSKATPEMIQVFDDAKKKLDIPESLKKTYTQEVAKGIKTKAQRVDDFITYLHGTYERFEVPLMLAIAKKDKKAYNSMIHEMVEKLPSKILKSDKLSEGDKGAFLSLVNMKKHVVNHLQHDFVIWLMNTYNLQEHETILKERLKELKNSYAPKYTNIRLLAARFNLIPELDALLD